MIGYPSPVIGDHGCMVVQVFPPPLYKILLNKIWLTTQKVVQQEFVQAFLFNKSCLLFNKYLSCSAFCSTRYKYLFNSFRFCSTSLFVQVFVQQHFVCPCVFVQQKPEQDNFLFNKMSLFNNILLFGTFHG